MSSPLDGTTTDVDVDAVPEVTTQESQAPGGATTGGAMPTVGTNAKSEWAMWDPNMWWTDWNLPPDPRPSWELWFDWVKQLEGLSPALGEASQDWQTMINQMDESLQSVRTMRGDLASWTGPSAQTMSDSLDRLENSITTKSAAIQNNPGKLRELSQAISEAVPPMTALDAEYQQVLQDLNACRQVAERGKPIMLNLANQLLQTGTDLENSAMTDNLAPQPVPPQALALTEGQQGPTQQLTQVAGSSGLTDPGAVAPGATAAVADQPTTAGASGVVDPGQVAPAQQSAVSNVPGVAVGPGDQNASLASSAPASTTAAPAASLAGVSTTAAPAAPVVATPVASAMPAAQFVAPTVASSGVGAAGIAPMMAQPSVAPSAERRDKDKDDTRVVGVPVTPAVGAAGSATGTTAVHDSLRGRTGGPVEPVTKSTRAARPGSRNSKRKDEAQPLDADAFKVEDAGGGTIIAPR